MSIKELLIQNESRCSLFEKQLRQRPLSVMPQFFKDGNLHPISFQALSDTLLINAGVSPQFNHLSNSTILTANQHQTSTQQKKIAVLFSGGPAAGGHNVIAGLKHILSNKHVLYGVKNGPKGLLDGDLFILSDDDVQNVLNLGGFDLLGSDRTKIKTSEQFEQVKHTVKTYDLDGLVIIGGDDSNTNAAFLADLLFDLGCSVVGVPKTIDGDLQISDYLPISFGFDTATKIYSELVGNILQDTPSSQKYWHFVKLMGRSASHITLEVALQTQPHITLISEEILEKNWNLNTIVDYIATIIKHRSDKGLNYGVILIPEGLIEFIPDFKHLIDELNQLNFKNKIDIENKLSTDSLLVFNSLPTLIQEQLLLDRDSHGNLKLSQINTELLLIDMVTDYFKKNTISIPFNGINHFFGYEGRCGAPSGFDASFTYNLGLIAGSLVLEKHTGYMAAISRFDDKAEPLGIPLIGLLDIERRDNKDAVVIKKAIVDLNSPAFQFFSERRTIWAETDSFSSPGPRQYWGPISKQIPLSTALNQGYNQLDYSFGSIV